MENQSITTEYFVRPGQLCIGLYVHLDLPWVDHPFAFPSFKIHSADQITALQRLGLQRIRYSPAKSDCNALEEPAAEFPTAAKNDCALSSEVDPIYQAKQMRIKRLASQQDRVKACEREFLSTTRHMKAVRQNLFSQPDQFCKLATEGIAKLADSMLVDAELSLQVMSDKVGGEDVFDHSLNVALLSMMVGREMKLPADEIQLLGLGGLLHDLGQAEIPEQIKNKTEALSKSEAALMRQHCALGVSLGKRLGLPSEVLLVIAQHHERIDGSGYPKCLQWPQLSLLSRIVAMIEIYDELCNPKHAARACSPHEALAIVYAQKNKQFDESAVTSFVRCLSVYPSGTIVLLSNGTLGMVTEVNSTRLLKPTVMVYDAAVSNNDAILVDLELEPEVTISKAIKPQLLSAEVSQFFMISKRTSYYFTAATENSSCCRVSLHSDAIHNRGVDEVC